MAKRRSELVRRCLLLLSFVLGTTGGVLGQDGPSYRYYEVDGHSKKIFFGAEQGGKPGRTVYVLDLATKQQRVFYTVPEDVLADLKVAPGGGVVGILSQIERWDVAPSEATMCEKGESAEKCRYVYFNRALTLMGTDGRKLASFDNVWTFAWSPDGSKIAMLTFQYQGHDADQKWTGVSVHDLRTKTTTKVSDVGTAYLAWASFDGNLYIYDSPPPDRPKRVVRYNFSTGQLEPTSHRGLYFSPSGSYYLPPEPPGGIWARQTDERLKDPLGKGGPVSWAPNADLLLLSNLSTDPSTPRKAFLYDPATGKAVELPANTVGWAGDASSVVVASGTSIDVQKAPSVK